VLAGVFVTAFYSFRMYFLVFHGKSVSARLTMTTTTMLRLPLHDHGRRSWPRREDDHGHHGLAPARNRMSRHSWSGSRW
jgi:NADH-quinone oxidoreductase subunit L